MIHRKRLRNPSCSREKIPLKMGGMRSKEEIRGIVGGFAKSGLTRGEYCAKHGVGMSTLDYWGRAQGKRKPKLVQVSIEEAPALSSHAKRSLP